MIAVISMLIDHTGYLLLGCGMLRLLPHSVPQYAAWRQCYLIMRGVGRVAFPVYAFLLTEGIVHTRNWKRYGLRLAIFALISEIPFDLLCFQKPICQEAQNVFFTLLIGLLTVKAADYVAQRGEGQDTVLIRSILIAAGCGIAVLFRTDYDYSGVLLIVLLYRLRQNRARQCIVGFVWMLITLGRWYYAIGLAAAFLLIGIYSGERGSARGKYAFYAFYPLHLLLLYLIYRQLMGS